MGTKVSAPPPRNYGQETRDTLQAQIDLNPALLRSEQETRPGWTDLELQSTRDALFGTGSNRGLIALYEDIEPRLSRLSAEGQSRQRAADLADVESYGPTVQRALRAADPAKYALLDELNSQSLAELRSGSRLSSSEQREVEQYVRAGQSARGMGLGPADVYSEAMTLGSAGRELAERRKRNAMALVQMNQGVSADPYLAILGRPSSALGQSASVAGQGMSLLDSLGPRMFQPESQYGADLYEGNYQGALAARTATAANRGSMFGGLLGALGSLGGAAIRRRY